MAPSVRAISGCDGLSTWSSPCRKQGLGFCDPKLAGFQTVPCRTPPPLPAHLNQQRGLTGPLAGAHGWILLANNLENGRLQVRSNLAGFDATPRVPREHH